MSLRSSPGEVAPKGLGRPEHNAIDAKSVWATDVRSSPIGYTASNNFSRGVGELSACPRSALEGALRLVPADRITHNTRGRGSNSERRQERDGLSSTKERHYPAQEGPFAGGKEASWPGIFSTCWKCSKQPNACTKPSVKTGYETAEDNCQVPRPITFRSTKPEKTARRSSVRESHAVKTASCEREAFGISRETDGATSKFLSWRGRVVFAPSRDLVFRGQLGQRKVRVLAASTNHRVPGHDRKLSGIGVLPPRDRDVNNRGNHLETNREQGVFCLCVGKPFGRFVSLLSP